MSASNTASSMHNPVWFSVETICFLIIYCISSARVSLIFILGSKPPVLFPSSSPDSSRPPSIGSGCLGTIPKLIRVSPTVCGIVIGFGVCFHPIVHLCPLRRLNHTEIPASFQLPLLFFLKITWAVLLECRTCKMQAH